MKKEKERESEVTEVVATPEYVNYAPPTDVIEQDKEVQLVMDVPGVGSEGVEIKVENRVLDISAVSPLLHRGQQIRFIRRFQLSDEIDTEQISARVKNGVLSLTLPKRPSAQVRKIKVVTD